MNIFEAMKSIIDSVCKTVPVKHPESIVTPLQPENVPDPIPEIKLVKMNLPDRDPNALTGSEFCNTIINMPANQARDNMIYDQIISGNMPEFMRNLKDITISNGEDSITYWVTPDVLCVGSDDDFVRMPLNPLTAQRIMDVINCSMPTKKMCDQIWANADLKLSPSPNGAPYTEVQQTIPKLLLNEGRIQKQIAGRKYSLITGHKKDVIIDQTLLKNKDKVAIYGWFDLNGKAIQGPMPNSGSHSNLYNDYSHGIRAIHKDVIVNGEAMTLYDVIKNPKYCKLLIESNAYDPSNIYKSTF